MRRVHEPYISAAGLIPTLRALGINGIVPTGELAWQTYPVAARAQVFTPGGLTAGFIAPNLLANSYQVTHINYASRSTVGPRTNRWSIQDSLGAVRREILFQNPGKGTGGVLFGQSVVASLPPIPLTPNLGVKASLTSAVTVDADIRAYITALLVQPQVVPSLLAVAPTTLGSTLPTPTDGTVVTENAESWEWGSYVQMTGGLATSVLVTAVIISSTSNGDGQVAFAVGGNGSEVDWGIFGWAEPMGPGLVAARYDLQPYPLFMPLSTRIAARVRGTTGSETYNVGLEYIPIPIR